MAGTLSEQLQRRIRQGQYFKTVGFDLNLSAHPLTPQAGGTVTGKIRYYLPTQGRCEAYRNGFKSMMNVFKTQGINIRANQKYDFRVPLANTAVYVNGAQFLNVSSIDGATQLDLSGLSQQGLFHVHNESVVPTQQGGINPTGFGAYGSTSDYVLNDGSLFDGNPMVAERGFEEIPFTITLDVSDNSNTTFQWRPDPALYLAILTGQFEINIDELEFEAGATQLILDVNAHVSGWKSIMSTPKPRKPRKTGGKK